MGSSTEGEKESDDFDNVAEKSFLKMKSTMEKDGYREGIEEGKSKVFQKYFDDGYKDGFVNGYSLGKLKGALCAKNLLTKSKSTHVKELENSSTGACIVCEDNNYLSFPISQIKLDQEKVLQTPSDMAEH